jgi:alpha-L-arabinofuranosidase
MREWLEYLSYAGDSTLARLRQSHGHAEPWPIRLWGVGNESWGCGGFMDVTTYAREYRRFAAFLQLHSPDRALCRVACGADGEDFDWTDRMMALCKHGSRHLMEALSVHLYCSVRAEGIHALDSSEKAWFLLLQKAERFLTALRRHCTLMDAYDPAGHVALAVDEWGVWYAPLPSPTSPPPPPPPAPQQSTSTEVPPSAAATTATAAATAQLPPPAGGDMSAQPVPEQPDPSPLLEQPGTLRDALLAALCLHNMVACCERVRVANLAQAINALHALEVVMCVLAL